MMLLQLEFPDDQCAYNCSGILCGACQHKLSQVLGSSKCMECSNKMLGVILLVTFTAGILLVGFLMLFNMTVAAGTINGLTFYANIIGAGQVNIFFMQSSSTYF